MPKEPETENPETEKLNLPPIPFRRILLAGLTLLILPFGGGFIETVPAGHVKFATLFGDVKETY